MRQKASKIKITIIEPSSNLKLSLPALHFTLISILASFGLLMKPIILKYAELDENIKNIIQKIDRSMIDELLRELKSIGPLDLVDVSTGDGTKVKISTL